MAEADESDGSFLKLQPTIAVVTNIDPEHLDYYGTFEELFNAFRTFVEKVPFYGLSIICGDHPRTRELTQLLSKRYWTYGLDGGNDVSGRVVGGWDKGLKLEVWFKGKKLGVLKVPLFGEYNARNVLAAVAVGIEVGLTFESIEKGVEEFKGVKRRFELKGKVDGVTFVDDYGHHPEEIRATLKTAKEFWSGRVVVVFQPHRYTRTKLLFQEFLGAFDLADLLLLMEIYPAGEDPIPGVTAKSLFEALRERLGDKVFYAPYKEEVKKLLKKKLRKGDMLLTLGAGDVWRVGEELLEELS